ncbi:MAG: flagellar assembly protein FliW [Lachnospiraceae bacterium]|nr:flagellar assembly protein FliW [Lachnospiraceae bacterium]
MEIKTRIFGTVDVADDKLIKFEGGLVGFPELIDFALIHDLDDEKAQGIQWMQSVQEPQFAIPVIDPVSVMEQYNPQIEDELLKPLGELNADNMLVLVTVTVPRDISQMSVNLRGPIIINTDTRKAAQVIAEGDEYAVKYPVYEILKSRKEEG